ncbi:MAG: dipicolinate synthase subunit B [Oscillospiraceae bacterium]|jgi:dipicolinate synthase subunit B|nr:dipicolinate synthase subunit B [Oscillospiraceae bacterium]
MLDFTNITIGFAVTGSFCTFDDAFRQARSLVQLGAKLIPVMSETAYYTDTRFGGAKERADELSEICGAEIIRTIADAEPLGPGKVLDVLLVCPCTGNTMAKLANSITDTPVTMAVKSHIRNNRPAVLSIATNDALAGSAKNMGALMNLRNYFFVPLRQDDSANKPASLVSDFMRIPETVEHALRGTQLQPVIFS